MDSIILFIESCEGLDQYCIVSSDFDRIVCENDHDEFVISYTTDPKTGKAVTLNNRGLAALSESGKFPSHAIHVPYDKVPKHLVADIKNRPPSKSINITRNKEDSGFIRSITNTCH